MTQDDEIVFFCAFRYALGRHTCVTSIVARKLVNIWDELSRGIQITIHGELADAFQNKRVGDPCDEVEWKKLQDLPLKDS